MQQGDWRHAGLLLALKVVCADSSVAGSENLQMFGLRSAVRLLSFLNESKTKQVRQISLLAGDDCSSALCMMKEDLCYG